MKILHIYKTAYPLTYGGIEQMIHQLALGCSEVGVDVKVLCLSDQEAGSTVVNDKYTIFYVKKHAEIASMGFSFDYLKKYKELALESDLIHYHFPWPFMDLIQLAGCKRARPYIVTYHSDIVRQKYLNYFYAPLMWRFLEGAEAVITTSPNYLKTSRILQRIRKKITIIPIGLSEVYYKNLLLESKIDEWKKKLGKNFFLFIGAFRDYKGLEVLLSIKEKLYSDIVIIGSGKNEKNLKILAQDNKHNKFVFLGSLADEDMVAVLSLCISLVLPSNKRSEAFGISLLEAAIFSKPLISCEIGTGTSYINLNGITGIVVPPNDTLLLFKAMNYFLLNERVSERMGLAAYKRYVDYFTLDKVVSSYCQLYNRITDR